MPRIIVIGECTLDVLFPRTDAEGRDLQWPLCLTGRPASRLFNAAAMLSRHGRDVTFVGEAARDRLGDLLVGYLKASGVDTRCIDRYSDGGVTATNLLFPDGSEGNAGADIIINRHYPSGENFNVTWPRIDASDIVVFGGYFSIAERSRQQITEILQYASERHAIIVYAPGFAPALVPRITRVMPAILENLELADAVMTSTGDLRMIFDATDVAECYRRNISFYCRNMVNVDPASGTVTLYHNDRPTEACINAAGTSLEAQSAALARLVNFMAEGQFTTASIDGLSLDAQRDLTDAIAAAANTATI